MPMAPAHSACTAQKARKSASSILRASSALMSGGRIIIGRPSDKGAKISDLLSELILSGSGLRGSSTTTRVRLCCESRLRPGGLQLCPVPGRPEQKQATCMCKPVRTQLALTSAYDKIARESSRAAAAAKVQRHQAAYAAAPRRASSPPRRRGLPAVARGASADASLGPQMPSRAVAAKTRAVDA